jgi:probable F420-dependent oxidoreductase
MAAVRIGAKLPNSGRLPFELGVGRMAATLEAAGFDSVWTSDHVVFPRTVTSRYPFASDGRITWSLEEPYLEPIVALSAVTSTTSTVELGTSALILPMRNPVLFAKQAACIDALAGGRLVLGVGVGWLREEFEALGADFESRGEVLDEWVAIARACWEGEAGPLEGRHYALPHAVYCRPEPTRKPPVLVGGMSRPALMRAGRIGDGWLAQYSMDTLSERDIASALLIINRAGQESGRKGSELRGMRVVVRITGSEGRHDALAERLAALARAGVTEVIVDVAWDDPKSPARAFNALKSAAA